VSSSPLTGFARGEPMPDSDFLEGYGMPLAVGEAYGRVRIPLAGLPDGVAAYTVPVTDTEGAARVPVDRKKRLHPKEADLITERPVRPYGPPAGIDEGELRWILETGSHRQWASVEKRLGGRAWDVCADLIRAGGVVVRCGVADVRDWKPRRLYLTRTWAAQAADVVRELRGLPVPFEARLNLITLIAGIPGLEDEAALLAAMPDSDPLRVPRGARTKTTRWTTHEAAIRAACFWYRHQQPGGRRLTEREVAGHALGGTKEWTDASKAAFAALLGRPIDQILDKADHDIRVRGPLWWTVGETAADARRGYPWVGLPSGGIHAMGNVQDDARGVLVIENADTFQQVCMHCPEVTDRWLCVWGKGSATSGVVAFLELMSDVPIAVWGDLDAYGIQIVTNLAERLKRDITPVAMTADLYAGGPKYKPDDIDDSKRVAEKMVTDGLPALQGLAQVIADADGLGCEQETLYDEVLPTLAEQLTAIEGSDMV
jgi:hypothetical protein